MEKIDEPVLTRLSAALLRKAAIEFPEFYFPLIEDAVRRETNASAKSRLQIMLETVRISREEKRPICQDTGIPFYFVTIGENARYGGDIQRAINKGTELATKGTPLRENVVHPLTSQNNGTNVGWGIPYIFYDYKPNADYLEITAVPRGGGEDAPTTIVRIPSVGAREASIKKGILEVIYNSRWACPPHIVGICIGANVTIGTHVALRASFRVPTGARNSDPIAARLEDEMLDAINGLGIGPMGLGGDTTALAVHIELVGSHTARPAIVVAPGCWTTGRFAIARIFNDGTVRCLTHKALEGFDDAEGRQN